VRATLPTQLGEEPLNGLWGAAISVASGSSGILVTNKLDLHVQRFTLAHELGHVLLGHENMFDLSETIGFAGRFGPTSRPAQELAADTFASEVLAPRALMLANAKRHNWTSSTLSDPANVYQLSLRLAISFQATCWALAAQNAITRQTAVTLVAQTVKSQKQKLAPAGLITNPWASVWKLTEADTSTSLEAGLDDLFAVQLQDYSSAGYLWELVGTGPRVRIVETATSSSLPDYGAPASRVVFLHFETPGVHRLHFEHRRPWNQQTLGYIDIDIDNNGKEQGGFDHRTREAALLAGAA
jgi:Zn-dependent peptidase ImmA (M78 family)